VSVVRTSSCVPERKEVVEKLATRTGSSPDAKLYVFPGPVFTHVKRALVFPEDSVEIVAES
jgi:hypothetical protein